MALETVGKCYCQPGWQGEKCDETCPKGLFGLKCSQHCRCKNDATCRVTDGLCVCPPGWQGAFCTKRKLTHRNIV